MERTIQSNTQLWISPSVSVSRRRTRGIVVVRLLFGLVFLGVGIFVLVWAFKNLKQARASASWPSVSGMIVASDVEVNRSDSETRYAPRIQYDYKVGGTMYASGRISFGGRKLHQSPDAAQAELANYPVGKAVTVYHDPAVPNSSVLQPGVTGSVYLVFAAGLLFILVGPMAAWFGKSGRRRIVFD